METTFDEYLKTLYPARSGTRASYLKAIKILDEVFRIQNPFGLSNKSLIDIRDPYLIADIIDFVADQEDKFRRGENSVFDYGSPTQTSYPRKRFCTAAIRRLGDYITQCCNDAATEIMRTAQSDGSRLSRKLLSKFRIDDRGTDREVRAKRRVGQDIFRAILLDIYESRCCLTGIDVPDVLRASHIIPWSESKNTRLNPENGLCLSATYDAAFDKHLVTFDEDYRLVLSPVIKERYTSQAFRTHFLRYEGKRISLPTKFIPSRKFLEEHRSKLVV